MTHLTDLHVLLLVAKELVTERSVAIRAATMQQSA